MEAQRELLWSNAQAESNGFADILLVSSLIFSFRYMGLDEAKDFWYSYCRVTERSVYKIALT